MDQRLLFVELSEGRDVGRAALARVRDLSVRLGLAGPEAYFEPVQPARAARPMIRLREGIYSVGLALAGATVIGRRQSVRLRSLSERQIADA